MKKYVIDCKTDWIDLTVADYQELSDLENLSNLQLVSILTNLSLEEVRELSVNVLNSIIDEIDFIYQDTLPMPNSPNDFIVMGDTAWKLNLDMSTFSAGRFVDVVEMSADPDAMINDLHFLIALTHDRYVRRKWIPKFISPWAWKKVDYSNRNLKKDAKYILDNFSIVYGMTNVNFFLKRYNNLHDNGPDYSVTTLSKLMRKRLKNQLQTISTNSGDGTVQSNRSHN